MKDPGTAVLHNLGNRLRAAQAEKRRIAKIREEQRPPHPCTEQAFREACGAELALWNAYQAAKEIYAAQFIKNLTEENPV